MLEIKIPATDAGQRIDKFLRKYLPGAPLTAIYKAIRTGKIKLDGKRVKNEDRLNEDQVIVFHFPDDVLAEYRQNRMKAEEGISKETADFSSYIVFEDESILAVNKPPKLNVHPGDHKTKEVSLIQLAHDYLWEKSSSLTFTPSLVHRIDRDTTGMLLIAKDRHCLNTLLDELQSHKMEKIYLAIVVGQLDGNGTIRAPLLRTENAKNTSKVKIDPNGQKSITHYEVLASCETLSLVSFKLETGRMHQIRVHAASIWHPILWDTAYGNQTMNRRFEKELSINRQLLHAWKLWFVHPKTKKQCTLAAPVPEDIQRCIKSYFPVLVAFDAL